MFQMDSFANKCPVGAPFFETDGYYCATLNPIFPIRFLTSDIVFYICKTSPFSKLR